MHTRYRRSVHPGPVMVGDSSARKLVEVVRSPGGDTIGFETATQPCDRTLSPMDDMQVFTRKLLDGRIAVPLDHPLMPMNAVAARLIAHHGIHPLAVAALGTMIEPMNLERDEDLLVMTHATLEVCSVYHTGFSWTEIDRATLVLEGDEHHDMPASMLAAMVGRPLQEIVSHPALDGMRLTIASAEPDEFGARLNVGVHLAPGDRSLTRAMLEALAPTT